MQARNPGTQGVLRAAALLAFLVVAGAARSQDLEPRAYASSPVGANFVLLSYGYQQGEVLFDPSLPLTNVNAFVNSSVASYGRSFSLAGRHATVAIAVPYVWASVGGDVFEQYQEITRSGLADLRARFVVNLLGGPALPPREWAARKPGTTLGFSLVAVAPTGQYSPDKLINIGSNRWAFKPELGVSIPSGAWTFEAAAGTWFFADNSAAYPGGTVRSQDPLFAFQAHVGYTFLPGLWLAADATYYAGGKTYADGVPGDTRQANSRAGATLSLPLGRQHTVKFSAATGVSARVGSRFDTYGIAYQFIWFDRQPPAPSAGAESPK